METAAVCLLFIVVLVAVVVASLRSNRRTIGNQALALTLQWVQRDRTTYLELGGRTIQQQLLRATEEDNDATGMRFARKKVEERFVAQLESMASSSFVGRLTRYHHVDFMSGGVPARDPDALRLAVLRPGDRSEREGDGKVGLNPTYPVRPGDTRHDQMVGLMRLFPLALYARVGDILVSETGLDAAGLIGEATGTEVAPYAGSAGSVGMAGSGGSTGTSGMGGISGSAGVGGVTGTSGTGGDAGTTGTAGTSGAGGDSGTSGTAGTSGAGGDSGTSGTAGTSGTGGDSGTSGTAGTSGAGGDSGTSGTAGTSGSGGGSGTSGTAGTSGAAGASGAVGVDDEIDEIIEAIARRNCQHHLAHRLPELPPAGALAQQIMQGTAGPDWTCPRNLEAIVRGVNPCRPWEVLARFTECAGRPNQTAIPSVSNPIDCYPCGVLGRQPNVTPGNGVPGECFIHQADGILDWAFIWSGTLEFLSATAVCPDICAANGGVFTNLTVSGDMCGAAGEGRFNGVKVPEAADTFVFCTCVVSPTNTETDEVEVVEEVVPIG